MSAIYRPQFAQMFNMIVNHNIQNSMPILGYFMDIAYPYQNEPQKHPADKTWGRVSTNVVVEAQSGHQKDGVRKYTTEGLLYLQLMITKKEAEAYKKADAYARSLRSLFRRGADAQDMIFRNTRVVEGLPEDLWFRLNFITEFEYDEHE